MSLAQDIKDYTKTAMESAPYLTWEDIFVGMDLEEVKNEIDSQDRWSTIYEIVVRRGDEFARVYHSRGSTEYQENDTPLEELDYFTDVVPAEKTIIVYEDKK